MAHLGLTPQSINVFGGFKSQAKELEPAKKLIRDALAVQEAGAFAVTFECVPAKLAELATKKLAIPTIGIGAGADCDGQVLVYADMLAMFSDYRPKFVKNFANVGDEMKKGFKGYVDEVKNSSYPAAEHGYTIDSEIMDEIMKSN